MIKSGTPVKFLVKLGAVRRGEARSATRFVGAAAAGQTGLYDSSYSLPDGSQWHVVQFGAWDVPCDSSHFEVIEG